MGALPRKETAMIVSESVIGACILGLPLWLPMVALLLIEVTP